MNSPTPGAQASPLIDRVKNILLQPRSEWAAIDAEPATVGGIYRGYVAILAAIPAICGLIGGLLIGHNVLGITVHPSVTGAVTGAAVSYVLTLVGVYVLAVIIDLVAPNFNATPNRIQAFKVAAYSGTASWVAGIFLLVPALAVLSLLGLYGLYLLYLGLPRLMKAPEDKALGYTAVVVICAIVLAVIVGALTAPVAGLFSRAAPDNSSVSGSIAIPGVGSVDVGKLEDASKRMEAAAGQINGAANSGNGAVTAVPGTTLQALLPASLGPLARTEISSASGSAAGIGGSQAEARYAAGDSSVHLEVTDMAAAGALAALGGALNIQSSRQTETGYEKTETVDGRMTSESWDSQSRDGKFGVVVANRFMVEARGQNVDMALLKGAVGAIGLERLEALAK